MSVRWMLAGCLSLALVQGAAVEPRIGHGISGLRFASIYEWLRAKDDGEFRLTWTGRRVFDAELPFPAGATFLPHGHYKAEVSSLPASMRFVDASGKTVLEFSAPTNVAPPYVMHVGLSCRHPALVCVEQPNAAPKVADIVPMPLRTFDPSVQENLSKIRVEPVGGMGAVTMTQSAGVGQADVRFVTRGRECRPYVEDGRVFFTFSVRYKSGHLGVGSIDPARPEDGWRFEGTILFDYGDGRYANDLAAHLWLDDESGEWRAWTSNFSTEGRDLDGKPVKRAPGGISVAVSKASPLHGFSVMRSRTLGLSGMNEDPSGCWDARAKKWRLLVSAFTPNGIKAQMLESDRWDGGFTPLTGTVSEDSTGTTIARINGEFACLAGSVDRAYYVYSYPTLEKLGTMTMDKTPWGDKTGWPHGRGWPAYLEVEKGGVLHKLLLTMDRENYPGMPNPNWTYGTLFLYRAGVSRETAATSVSNCTTKLMFSFDTEDFTNPRSADAILRVAELFESEGLVGHFQVVGQLARQLENWGRQDVIKALSRHLIGTHTLNHSIHPNMLELSDGEDYAAAYGRVMAQESECVATLKRVFKTDRIWSSSPSGTCESYVADRVYADLGIDYGVGPHYTTMDGDDIWFAGLRRIAYVYSWDEFFYQGPNFDRSAKKLLDQLAKSHVGMVFLHPNFAYSKTFWDRLNYNGGNYARWGEWKLSPPRDKETVDAYFDWIRHMLRAIKQDPRFELTTIPELDRARKPRRPIRRDDLAKIRECLRKDFTTIREPASWCLSDVFVAVVKMLRGEGEYLPGAAYGFLSRPVGVANRTEVSRADLVQAAKAMDVSGFLPSSVCVGSAVVGPADFLFAGLDVLVDGTETAVVVPKEQLGRFKGTPLEPLEHRVRVKIPGDPRSGWMHTTAFRDEYTGPRLRWQLWTFRYE